jgi:hypothetical protein
LEKTQLEAFSADDRFFSCSLSFEEKLFLAENNNDDYKYTSFNFEANCRKSVHRPETKNYHGRQLQKQQQRVRLKKFSQSVPAKQQQSAEANEPIILFDDTFGCFFIHTEKPE